MSTQVLSIAKDRSVVIPDANSGLTTTMSMAIAVAISESTHFQPVSNGYSVATTTRNNALPESMRASSPTRTRPNPDHQSWILHHPSALVAFPDIMRASKGKQIVVFLDYDGTLSPIVDDPDRAFITAEMRETVRDVAKLFPTAIISGRRRAKVYNFVRLSELYYAGSHGMDIKGPTKGNNQSILCQPAKEFLPMIDEIYNTLMERVKCITGAKVENNKFCLSVHYRCVDEKVWDKLAEQVKAAIKDYPRLRMMQGRKVLEIRPAIKWDKGNAVEFLLESLDYTVSEDVFPVYIGDDRTDEDAFKVLRKKGQSTGILVSQCPKETSASYSLREPSEVMQFLKRLVEWTVGPV